MSGHGDVLVQSNTREGKAWMRTC